MQDNHTHSILVIEDETLVRNSIIELLEVQGYNIYTADNGKTGIKLATEHLPDLIISDIMMPDITGLEVLETLKAMTETSTIPFVFLTAKAEKNDFRRGMEMGADDYIAKPFTKKDLYSAIQSQLHKYENIKQLHEHKIRDLKLTLSISLPHELRTPLNGIYSVAQFLLANSENLDASDRFELYNSIANSSTRLNRLIQNYLLYTDLELYDENIKKKPEVDLKSSAFDPEDSLYSAINNMRDFENYDDDIDLNIDHPTAFAILIRPNHLQKIMEELLSNAFKFQQKGEPPVKITSGIDTEKNIYKISVCNYGTPLSKHEIDSVSSYVQFRRDKNEQQGLGLGLFIVKSLVELYDGGFEVDSMDGTGNRFTVTLPITTTLTNQID